MPDTIMDRIIQVILNLDHDQLVLLAQFLDQLEAPPDRPMYVQAPDPAASSHDQ